MLRTCLVSEILGLVEYSNVTNMPCLRNTRPSGIQQCYEHALSQKYSAWWNTAMLRTCLVSEIVGLVEYSYVTNMPRLRNTRPGGIQQCYEHASSQKHSAWWNTAMLRTCLVSETLSLVEYSNATNMPLLRNTRPSSGIQQCYEHDSSQKYSAWWNTAMLRTCLVSETLGLVEYSNVTNMPHLRNTRPGGIQQCYEHASS